MMWDNHETPSKLNIFYTKKKILSPAVLKGEHKRTTMKPPSELNIFYLKVKSTRNRIESRVQTDPHETSQQAKHILPKGKIYP